MQTEMYVILDIKIEKVLKDVYNGIMEGEWFDDKTFHIHFCGQAEIHLFSLKYNIVIDTKFGLRQKMTSKILF